MAEPLRQESLRSFGCRVVGPEEERPPSSAAQLARAQRDRKMLLLGLWSVKLRRNLLLTLPSARLAGPTC